MLGETVPNPLSSPDSHDLGDSPTLTLDYSPLDSLTREFHGSSTPKSHTVPSLQPTATPNFAAISRPAMSLAELAGILQQPHGQPASNQMSGLAHRLEPAPVDIPVNTLLPGKATGTTSYSDLNTQFAHGISNGHNELPKGYPYHSEIPSEQPDWLSQSYPDDQGMLFFLLFPHNI